MNRTIPAGLVGVEPRDPIGVAVTMGIKGKGGAPMLKDRFWLMSPQTASTEFHAGGKSYRSPARTLHPSFARWNDAAKAGEAGAGDRRGPGRVGTIRGNLVHADLKDAAFWNRAAQKLPEPHENPPSQRPACEGNGITALRFSGITEGREEYESIACPNEDCPFAIRGLCKPHAMLLFRLRWDQTDEFERGFPSLLAMWSTRGWNSLRNLLGLFELVLGTEAVAPWEPREKWKTGLAQELGLDRVSLVGMPFVMTIGEKTKPSEQKRFTVVSFSPDGDLVEWLVNQRRQRELAGGTERLALPPISCGDSEIMEDLRHGARSEFDPAAIEIVPGGTAIQPPPVEEKKLSPEKAASILAAAERKGGEDLVRALEATAVRLAGTPRLTEVPERHEMDLLRTVERARGKR